MDHGASSYRRFLDGDESGLCDIVKEYGDGLMFFINEVVNDYFAAEDLMEDTFAELIFKKHSFNGNALFKTYLYKIGRNKALNYLKKQSRTRLQLPETENADESASLEASLLNSERNRALYKAMRALMFEYRQILHLLYFEDMSYLEAGLVMKKSEKQIKNLAYRAKQALRRRLEKEEGFEYYEDL